MKKQDKKQKKMKKAKQAGETKQAGKKKSEGKENSEGLTPEQQEKMDLFLINGMEIIHSQKFTESFLGHVKAVEDPIAPTAETLVRLILRLKKSARANNKPLDDTILAHGANILLGEMLRILEAAGMEPLSDQQKMACWQLSISQYFKKAVETGEMSKEELIRKGKSVSQTKEGKKILKAAKKPEFNSIPEVQ